MDIFEKIRTTGLVPVITLHDESETGPVIEALIEGDLPVAEICYRTPCAGSCLRLAVSRYPDVLVGAGTVINAAQCREAIGTGARFIVSPGFSPAVAAECAASGIPYLPGVVTPTEIMQALDAGLTHLKFFPAGVYGGLNAIKALSAAFPQCEFLPTGGVDNGNLPQFIANNKILACGGSWLVKGSPEQIVKICREARSIVRKARG